MKSFVSYQECQETFTDFFTNLSQVHQQEVKQLKKKIHAKGMEVHTLQKELSECKYSLQNYTKNSGSSNSTGLEGNNMTIKQLIQINKQYKMKCANLQETVDKLKQQNCSLQQELQKCKEELEKIKTHLTQIQKNLETEKASKHNLEGTVSMMQFQILEYEDVMQQNHKLKKLLKENEQKTQEDSVVYSSGNLVKYFKFLIAELLQNNKLEIMKDYNKQGFFDLVYLVKESQQYGIAQKMTYESVTDFLMRYSIRVDYIIVFNRYAVKII